MVKGTFPVCKNMEPDLEPSCPQHLQLSLGFGIGGMMVDWMDNLEHPDFT